MPTFQRPGVAINEVLTASAAAIALPGDSVAAFVGAATRGPTTPTLISSWAEYVRKFGDFTFSSNMAMAVWMFFANGGNQAWVTRVVGTGSVVATRNLQDITPATTLTVNAVNAGAWANGSGSTGIFLDVVANGQRFDLTVYYGGTTTASVVEQWTDLSMTTTDSRYAVALINNNSQYITTVDAGTGTVPVAVSGQPLASGANGSAAADADFTAAVNLLANIPSPIVLNLPGETAAARLNAVIASTAFAAGNIFMVADPPSAQTPTQVLSWAASLTSSGYVAAYYPWLVINDPSKYTPNATATVPPGGAVVGEFLATDSNIGPHKTPAGVQARITGAVDLQTTLQPTDYDSLNSTVPPVNAIKPIPGFGICVFGGRTLKPSMPDKYISVRRSLIYIEQGLKNLTQFAIFQPNDEHLWSSISSDIRDWLSLFYDKGGLRGTTPQEAFYVVCDGTNNTTTTISNGIVNVEVGVALQYPAEFIVIRIGQFEGGTTVTNSLAQ